MTKTPSKIIAIGTLLILGGLLFTINPTEAVYKGSPQAGRPEIASGRPTTTPATNAASTTAHNQFCTNIDAWAQRFAQQVNQNNSKLSDKKAEIKNRLTIKRSEIEDKLTALRADWDAKRSAKMVQLQNRELTEQQRQAINDFQNQINAAISARRNTFNQALNTFQNRTQEINEEQKQAIISAGNTYREAVRIAAQQAKEACTAGTDPLTVRNNFQQAVKTAQETMKTSIEASKKQTALQTALSNKKQALQDAVTTFQNLMEQAKNQLRQALGK